MSCCRVFVFFTFLFFFSLSLSLSPLKPSKLTGLLWARTVGQAGKQYCSKKNCHLKNFGVFGEARSRLSPSEGVTTGTSVLSLKKKRYTFGVLTKKKIKLFHLPVWEAETTDVRLLVVLVFASEAILTFFTYISILPFSVQEGFTEP